ncbi:MAG: efflux RND transporter periplasmic adaptor subunit [Gammaproteobacteria bacterium]|nr:efflux RND transporter periplasmic adaptor subunit [Gammaproteobacteria bacterium]
MALGKISTIIVIAVVMSLTGCHGDSSDKPKPPPLVKTVVIGDYHRTAMRTFPGIVSADKQVDLSFEVSGRLTELPVDEGSELKQGDLIAVLDPESYQATYDRTKARYELAVAQLKRAKPLVKKGYLSQSGYDQRVSDYDVSKADFRRAKIDLEHTQLRAPFDGIVTQKIVDNHQYIQANHMVVVFKSVDEINIEANIPERVIAYVEGPYNHAVKVLFEVAPNKEFNAVLKEFSADADPQTKTYKVTVTMPRPKYPKIFPGMTARLKVPLAGERKPYLLLPVGAVLKQNGQATVWLVNADDQTLKAVPVQVGQLQGDKIEVTKGLKHHDRVVVAGVHFLQEGEKVNIMQSDGTTGEQKKQTEAS